MTKDENFHRDYGLLEGFLRSISNRFRIHAIIESLILLSSGIILILLGSLFTFELKEKLHYLPIFYSISSLVFIFLLFLFMFFRIFSRQSLLNVAKELEKRFSNLRDDITNSFLLFNEAKEAEARGKISDVLVKAQIKKTVEEISSIKKSDVVSLKSAFRHMRLLIPLSFAFMVILIFDPNFLNRSLALITNPFSTIPIKKAFISIEPEKLTILRGSPLLIKAKVEGKREEKLLLSIYPEGQKGIHIPMESEGEGRFKFEIASAQVSFSFQIHGENGSSPMGNITVIDPPEVSHVKLILNPPDYSRLPVEVREDGHIEALKGTIASIEAKTTKDIVEARLIINFENESSLIVKGKRLSGSLLVFQPGNYSIRVKDKEGFENPNPTQYRINLIVDNFPEVELINPTGFMEVSGNEVISILYRARDDFGLTSVRLNYEIRGKERFITLKQKIDARILGPEIFKWDLAGLNLSSGDRVIYRIEVSDNDTVSGPKKGFSKTLSFLVRDDKIRASEESDLAREIAERLLDLLSDHLEELKDRESLKKDMDDIAKRIDKGLEMMRERIERLDLEGLKRNLLSLRDRIKIESDERVTQELERLALFSEEIAKRLKMMEMEAISRELRNRQRRLIDSLKDLKENLSQEELGEVMKELKRIEELLRSVMETLSKMTTSLPQEFINSPELKGLDFQDLFKDLEELRKRLMANDIKGALEVAERLLHSLSEMMAALGRAGKMAFQAPYDRLQGEISRGAGELDKILEEQRDILSRTEGIERETKIAIDEEIQKRLKKMTPDILDLLKQLEDSIPHEHMERNLIKDLESLLRKDKFEALYRMLREQEKELSQNDDLRKLLKDLILKIEALKPSSKEVMSQENRMRFPGLSQRENNLKERTANLREKLEIISQLFPGMDTGILNDLREAESSMGEAESMLKSEDATGAIPPEMEAIRRLTKSRQSIDQMAQQMAMQMQAQRWGYPFAYDPRPGWYYGPWLPMPTLPQPEFMRPREKGYTGIDREEFEPPPKDAYKAPKILREKTMESLKEGIPSQYRREVERYLRGITE